MKLYDITHPLSNVSAYWPGDTPYQMESAWAIEQGSTVNLSRITLSPHNGTHADAPYHYDDGGLRMADVPPERYIGPARVVAVEGKAAVTEADLRALDLAGAERVLLRTGSCPDATRFNPGFTFLEPEAVSYLASLGVGLIGTDAHSVDPCESKDLPAHHACRRSGILILENLNLADVPVGEFELIALPLKLTDADGSPVRAVLRELPRRGRP